ncbi:ankyrin repeat domain-containing protein [Leptospira sp. 2 VSF19]|uniref:Ankyrin repeat domain-containing protein n=1 Tax=Leptospira soteropolitanensis TaxID=2950025 RepID=A0AAW5VDS7_9LEPT|nr:ankyrin repeat domain-containing protein [Leptospira soteropolitanensis]MCW7491823.1 ankyrin repeat domain-containing protein [Leptospira soteropolitanensis]MCW7499407.1 ankyrin repeat domain-containing protein [Leptospira soteropolitanensis]MCW7521002.1 ankyrin repeat domain-containing protein [Leptospira soteropolitanensis]MCW7525511.1 ankyrin repeat domain-containing protein [Leptospira soteropolitanensis]MCW7529377.1 ankyrin repeat domain-containing protein [Leptospira soteropolitanensi
MSLIDVAKSGSIEDWDAEIGAGADPNELDSYGTNALSWMLKMESKELFRHAILNGADPLAPYTIPGNVIFDVVSQNKESFLQILVDTISVWKNSKYLLTRDKNGNTIFHLAVLESAEPLWEVLVGLLTEEIVSLRNEEGRSVFLEAIVEDRMEIVTGFLKKFPDVVQHKDREGKTALHLVAERNLHELCSLLLEEGNVSLETKDELGNTALFLSASADAVECLTELLHVGANPFVWGEDEESITRLLDREKFGHSFKTWKDFVIQKAILGAGYVRREEMIDYIRKEKPFKPEELSKAKLVDLI